MELELEILNERFEFEDAQHFELAQSDNGDWIVSVDGEILSDSEFAPHTVTARDE